MIGTGTIANVLAIIAGSISGIVLKGGLPDRIQDIIFQALGVATLFIGILGVVGNEGNTLMLVLSLVLGAIVGEFLDLEGKMERFGEKLRAKVAKRSNDSSGKFVEGFVSASILFVVGSMAIIGSLNDGLLGDPTMLYTKAIMDGIASIVFAASLGIGVAFSALPILIYQGLITVLARVLSPYLTQELIRNMSFVGNAVIACIGINFLWPKKIKTGNLFPAMFMPILLGLFIK